MRWKSVAGPSSRKLFSSTSRMLEWLILRWGPGLRAKRIRSPASCSRSSWDRPSWRPTSILIKQWIGSPRSSICGVLISFALYSNKVCSLINQIRRRLVTRIRIFEARSLFYVTPAWRARKWRRAPGPVGQGPDAWSRDPHPGCAPGLHY